MAASSFFSPRRFALLLALLAVALPARALDVNTATAEQLQTFKGLGPRTVELILQERERGGPYRSMEDLAERVRGLGLRKIQVLSDAGMTAAGGASRNEPRPAAVPSSAAADSKAKTKGGPAAGAKPAAR